MQSDGVRLERRSTDTLAHGERLRPLRDQIIVKVMEWQPSQILEVAGSTRRPVRGRVVAAGPGVYPKRYNATRSKAWDSRAFRRTEVKAGDVVELGGLEIGGYSFPQILIENELHVIAREEDVTGITCE